MFVMLCYAYFASQTLVLCSTFPSVSFKVCTLMFVMLCMPTSPHTHWFCAVLFPRSPSFKVCTLMFVMLCYAYFASHTSGLCSAFPSVLFKVCTLMFVTLCYVYFASQTSNNNTLITNHSFAKKLIEMYNLFFLSKNAYYNILG